MTTIRLLVLLLAAAPAWAQTAAPSGPFVRTRLDPAGPVPVGQRVELALDVFVPTWFTSPPQLPALDVDGAFVTPLPNTMHETERFGDETWSAVRYYYAITAQTPGTITIPPIALTFSYAIDARPSDPVTLTTSPIAFEARVPPGAEALTYFFAASSLELTERYDPQPPPHLSVGDAFTRRIVVSAPDVNALTLPPLPDPAVAGLHVTAEPPEIRTSHERTGTRVTRTVRLTYVAEQPGAYTLPPVTLSYWSTTENAVRTRTLPAVRFDVAAAPAFTQEIALPPEPETPRPPPSRWAAIARAVGNWWRWVAGGLALLWLATRLGRRFGPVLVTRFAEARRRRLESEAHYFTLVERAARSGDLRATHRAALTWLARFPHLGTPASLTAIAERAGDAAMRQRMAAVNAALYGRRPGGDAAAAQASQLARDLAHARQQFLGVTPSSVGRAGPLPPLNPV